MNGEDKAEILKRLDQIEAHILVTEALGFVLLDVLTEIKAKSEGREVADVRNELGTVVTLKASQLGEIKM